MLSGLIKILVVVYIITYLMMMMFGSYLILTYFPNIIPFFRYAVIAFLVLSVFFVIRECWKDFKNN